MVTDLTSPWTRGPAAPASHCLHTSTSPLWSLTHSVPLFCLSMLSLGIISNHCRSPHLPEPWPGVCSQSALHCVQPQAHCCPPTLPAFLPHAACSVILSQHFLAGRYKASRPCSVFCPLMLFLQTFYTCRLHRLLDHNGVACVAHSTYIWSFL